VQNATFFLKIFSEEYSHQSIQARSCPNSRNGNPRAKATSSLKEANSGLAFHSFSRLQSTSSNMSSWAARQELSADFKDPGMDLPVATLCQAWLRHGSYTWVSKNAVLLFFAAHSRNCLIIGARKPGVLNTF